MKEYLKEFNLPLGKVKREVDQIKKEMRDERNKQNKVPKLLTVKGGNDG